MITVLLYFEFPPKKHLPFGQVTEQDSLAWLQNPLAPGYRTRLSLHTGKVLK